MKNKVLPEPQGGADLHFRSHQPDTSLHCETTNTGLVHRVVYLFMPELSVVLTAWDGQAELAWVVGYIY